MGCYGKEILGNENRGRRTYISIKARQSTASHDKARFATSSIQVPPLSL